MMYDLRRVDKIRDYFSQFELSEEFDAVLAGLEPSTAEQIKRHVLRLLGDLFISYQMKGKWSIELRDTSFVWVSADNEDYYFSLEFPIQLRFTPEDIVAAVKNDIPWILTNNFEIDDDPALYDDDVDEPEFQEFIHPIEHERLVRLFAAWRKAIDQAELLVEERTRERQVG